MKHYKLNKKNYVKICQYIKRINYMEKRNNIGTKVKNYLKYICAELMKYKYKIILLNTKIQFLINDKWYSIIEYNFNHNNYNKNIFMYNKQYNIFYNLIHMPFYTSKILIYTFPWGKINKIFEPYMKNMDFEYKTKSQIFSLFYSNNKIDNKKTISQDLYFKKINKSYTYIFYLDRYYLNKFIYLKKTYKKENRFSNCKNILFNKYVYLIKVFVNFNYINGFILYL